MLPSMLLSELDIDTKGLVGNAEFSPPLLVVLSGSTNEAPRWMGGKGRALKFLAMSMLFVCE